MADHEPKEYGIHVMTCSENGSLYSKREVIAAREARERQKRLFLSSDAGLVNIVAKVNAQYR